MRRTSAGVLALAVTAGLLAAPAVTAAPPEPAPDGPKGTVTLVTGDKVELRGNAAPSVTRGPGRETIPLRATKEGGRWTVLPLDAAKLVAQDRLDRRLFEVSTLLEWGYGDDKRDSTPLILQREPAVARSAPVVAGATATRQLPSIDAVVLDAAKAEAPAFWSGVAPAGAGTLSSGITKLWLNGKRAMTLDRSVAQVGAPAAWAGGWTGKQVEVAVLDSGIDDQHPDLAGKVAARKNFTGSPERDEHGHGTHVASTIGGTGAASGGKYKGVAPDVRLLDGKVCAFMACQEDWILAGMEWAAVERKAPIVNMSLGGRDRPGADPLESAVDRLSAEHGTLFVIAAGNDGLIPGAVGSPGSAQSALTVAAVDREDNTADFSSRGPRTGDRGLKPDISAPGVDIVAAWAHGTQPGVPVGDRYVTLSGTSMATPHVAGVAALLRQRHPDWNGSRLKGALMSSAAPKAGAYEQGAGRVDAARAVEQQVTTDVAAVDFGLARWPDHRIDNPVRKVTYRNDGSAAATLDLAVGGAPAAFAVSPARVTVPAGGTAEVTVTAKPEAVDSGAHGGRLVATANGVAVSTPVGFEKESEKYDLELIHIGRDGGTPADHLTYVDKLEDCGSLPYCGDMTTGSDGRTVLRVSPGDYAVTEHSAAKPGAQYDALMRSLVQVRGKTTVVLDARSARPVEVYAPNPRVRLMSSQVVLVRDVRRNGNLVATMLAGDIRSVPWTADLDGPRPPENEVYSRVYARLAQPGQAGDFTDTPYEYNAVSTLKGRAFTGLQYRPRQSDFGTVRTRVASPGPAVTSARLVHSAQHKDDPLALVLFPDSSAPDAKAGRVPFERDVHFQARDLRWKTELGLFDTAGKPLESMLDFDQVFTPGQVRRQDWGAGVRGPQFAPSFETPNGTLGGAGRHGDKLTFDARMFGDNVRNHSTFPESTGGGRLFRNGELVTEHGLVLWLETELPPEEAHYRYEKKMVVPWAAVSREVDVVWTFRSGHTDAYRALPVRIVQYTPELDGRNHARPGRGFTVPITLRTPDGAQAPPVKDFAMRVSFDSGKSWMPVPVERRGDGWQIRLDNPPGGAVSLRATVADTTGNTVEQTIVDAYRVR
ncbi:S8 family serine peptidase [Amycolatopsis suaedae]|uniref:Peptidase S8/S53 subtilisin kexin sedolisin n=1 Tax=Amycolatopsis suaedae TaxID=2510978 RepID=A0A4Q7J366_9PSEU|nr:S8 family serine peptidase [Amycolatopsis suaedae]RZQ60763.1 peptidase S8/S53 subtilisin kexin sedolisin [Amycolatopsis suaedae]